MTFLPGWHPGFIATAGEESEPVLTAFTHVARVYAGGANVDLRLTWPTVQPGDLAIMCCWYKNFPDAPPSEDQSDGFTSVSGATGTSFNERAQIGYRVCDGTESGTLTANGLTDNSDNKFRTAVLHVFRADVPITAAVFDAETYFNNGNPPAQTVLADVAPYIVFSIQHYDAASDDAPGGSVDAADLSYSEDHTFTGDVWQREWIKIFNSSPTDWTNNRSSGSASRGHCVTTIKISAT